MLHTQPSQSAIHFRPPTHLEYNMLTVPYPTLPLPPPKRKVLFSHPKLLTRCILHTSPSPSPSPVNRLSCVNHNYAIIPFPPPVNRWRERRKTKTKKTKENSNLEWMGGGRGWPMRACISIMYTYSPPPTRNPLPSAQTKKHHISLREKKVSILEQKSRLQG
ncbi:hypothetical protein T440DRAFT_204290 [Plenodomus tracheiphilus IPT5]|uniref:Uncharacterized protein n=1 Tax=Plenodomus tracheiphilus IPT5 TaxID=1408161 RepID=A0A6A7BKX2_9PLEO|nr:hypothetical protein T440DRAFT_204290 [Plenodomus tracheiphilus IPT5]